MPADNSVHAFGTREANGRVGLVLFGRARFAADRNRPAFGVATMNEGNNVCAQIGAAAQLIDNHPGEAEFPSNFAWRSPCCQELRSNRVQLPVSTKAQACAMWSPAQTRGQAVQSWSCLNALSLMTWFTK